MSSIDESEQLLNNTQYILAGPGPRDYWNHSPGLKQAMIKEEGPFLMQGNIGSLMKEDPSYTNCTMDTNIAPNINGSPNCTVAFTPDIYTKVDTCGESCTMRYPESYGLKDFGFPEDMSWKDKVTNASSLHTYQNLRAVGPGQFPASFGPIEWIPRVSTTIASSTDIGSGFLDPNPGYQQVGNFLQLPMYDKLTYIK